MALFPLNSRYLLDFVCIISALPIKLSIYIFRLLDPVSMKPTMQVRRSWYWLCDDQLVELGWLVWDKCHLDVLMISLLELISLDHPFIHDRFRAGFIKRWNMGDAITSSKSIQLHDFLISQQFIFVHCGYECFSHMELFFVSWNWHATTEWWDKKILELIDTYTYGLRPKVYETTILWSLKIKICDMMS